MDKRRAQQYRILTFGCQMNEHDSETIAGLLETLGFHETESESDADLLIVNTCAVRQKAEEKVYGLLGRLRPLKEQNQEMLIAVCGCMSQQEEVALRIGRRFGFVDLIFGTHALHRLPELLERARRSKKTVIDIAGEEHDREGLPVKRGDGLKAWIPIIYGCNNFCSYCIVPYVRGRERSRPPQAILQEARELAERGYREITLLGQNVNSYGRDRREEYYFADLLWDLNKIKQLWRIRYMTSHPRDFTPELIDVIQKADKVCEHFHLPLQSGSNRILQEMNRGYTREQYSELVQNIRARVPAASITTDIIVGYPGEEEADFAATLDMVQRLRFDAAFTFVYSPRAGTPAATAACELDDEVKKERIDRLIKLQNRITRENNERLKGTVQEVLVDKSRAAGDHYILSGRTRTNKLVTFRGDSDLKGELAAVVIDKAQTWNLDGTPVKDSAPALGHRRR